MMKFLADFAVSGDPIDLRVAENPGVEPGGLFRLIGEPETRRNASGHDATPQ
jgi:hypothetical protein